MDNSEKKAFVIGSMSNMSAIDWAATQCVYVHKSVDQVRSQPNKPLDELISECFDKIKDADIVYVVRKKDWTIGNGTLYEMEYARRLGKEIEVLDNN